MCEYIKDDGEQCGIDNHEGDFCHQHEDTRFAALWRRQSGSPAIEMDGMCADCESSLRRTERLKRPENRPNLVVFEALIECDCDEHVLGATTARQSELPGGWF